MDQAGLARILGVSTATVSLALRNSPRVASATRQRIQEAAEAHGYRPNPAFAALGARPRARSRFPDGLPVAYIATQPEFAGGRPDPILAQAVVEGERRGYSVRRFAEAEAGGWAQAPRVLRARGHVGVILGPSLPGDRVAGLDWSRFAVVTTVGQHRQWPYAHLDFRWFRLTLEALRELATRGYRRIGAALFGHAVSNEEDEARHAAAVWFAYEAPAVGDPVPLLRCAFDDRGSFLRWVDRHRPDAVLAFHAGAYYWLRESRRDFPGTPGFACLVASRTDSPPIYSGFDTNLGPIGAAAVREIDNLLRHGRIGPLAEPYTLALQAPWVEGPGLRPRPGAAGAAPACPAGTDTSSARSGAPGRGRQNA